MTQRKNKKKKPAHRQPPPQTQKSQSLAVCMIVKNEEQRLPDILADIQGLWDELVIVDTGSSDKTIEIAQKFGARVVEQPWTGDFSAARNRSKDEASSDWIMWLDADDRMEAAQIKQLQSLKSTLNKANIYQLQIACTVADGYGPPFMQVRLFPNDPRLRFENRIHETITLAAKKHGFKAAQLPVRIIHTGYEDPQELIAKMERNMRILEEELQEKPDAIVLRFLYANTLMYFNRFEEAHIHYEHITGIPDVRKTQDDVYHAALVSLAHIHNQAGSYRQSTVWAERATQAKPEGIQGWYQWGFALTRLGELQDGLEKFFRALACKPVVTSVQVDYANLRISCLEAAATVLANLNRPQEAKTLLENEMKQTPSPAVAALLDKLQNKQGPPEEDLLQKGQQLLESKSYIEASKVFIQAIEAYPQSFAAYNGLGLVSWYFGKYDDAYALFKKSVQCGASHEDIFLNVWDAAQATGNTEDAIAVIKEAVENNPDLKNIFELLEKNI